MGSVLKDPKDIDMTQCDCTSCRKRIVGTEIFGDPIAPLCWSCYSAIAWDNEWPNYHTKAWVHINSPVAVGEMAPETRNAIANMVAAAVKMIRNRKE